MHDVTHFRIEPDDIIYAKVEEYYQTGFLWRKELELIGIMEVMCIDEWYFVDKSGKSPHSINNLHLDYLVSKNKRDKENKIKYGLEYLKSINKITNKE